MIRSSRALIRHAQEFFLAEMVGLYDWGAVVIEAPEPMPAAKRREAGVGKYREKERISFGPWEILVCSSHEKPPLGQITLRSKAGFGSPVVDGPLDPATWRAIGEFIRSASQRKAS